MTASWPLEENIHELVLMVYKGLQHDGMTTLTVVVVQGVSRWCYD